MRGDRYRDYRVGRGWGSRAAKRNPRSEGLGEQRAAAAAAAERRRATSRELRRLEAERGRPDRAHRSSFISNWSKMTNRLEELRQSIAEIDRRAATADEEREREEQQIAEATARLEQARERADESGGRTRGVESPGSSSRATCAPRSRFRGPKPRLACRLCARIVQPELSQSLAELALEHPLADDFDLETGQARVEELRTRLDGFGAVNMMALEELTENEDRLHLPDGAASGYYRRHSLDRRGPARNQAPFA